MGGEKRKWKRVKERVAVTAQLYVGEDDDLIDWLITLPEGARNRAIKSALRTALGLPQPELRRTEIDELRAELAATRETVMQVASTASTQQIEELAEYIETLEKRVVTMAQWLERDMATWVQDVVDRSIGSGPRGDQPPVIEDAPQLTKEDQVNRKEKLKRAEW